MLEDTGERIIPKEMNPENGMLLEHLARYMFALPYVYGRVLDIAAGSGYGAQMTAKKQKHSITEVIGVDVDPETIRYARRHYHHPLLTFKEADALDPDITDKLGTFDTILSFETMEHVPDDQAFFQNLLKLLRPGGTLILSTPFGQGRGRPANSIFHYHQVTEEEFKELFRDYPATSFYYQRGVTIEPKRAERHYPIGVAVCRKEEGSAPSVLTVSIQHGTEGPVYIVHDAANGEHMVSRERFYHILQNWDTQGDAKG
ncbi:class I SAM-dependent methyltransferase [Salibacterium halotolerans]|uniref:Methyltransferase domain-containing protein n=1 Tax=Salibacterium halotolerans TaxID=1884432 RepID=A0A1I5TSR4_9BACI|nr:Methyltransferase domain-containing protein [Salibacterium halotolerans]